ncbi:MAG: glycogen synthase [Candidatus Omnitrophica bacterium]|nr:glycogen synthase [Candidatus Omnitrophota bacterium]
MKILFCASEVTPFAQTGGLGEVAGSLPLALGKLGLEVAVVMPRYRGIVCAKKRLGQNVTGYFIENEAYFNRAFLYGNGRGDYPDNLERFSFFCHEALALAKALRFKPDIVHAHDWQAALLPVLLKTKVATDPFFEKTKCLLTMHNLQYQGIFPSKAYASLGLDEKLFDVKGFEFYGKINLLKAGILYADALNTVSPTYAKEILTPEYGFGLEGVLREKTGRLKGILNGIDGNVWDPAKDRWLKKHYSSHVPKAKELNKAALQASCGFEKNPRIPVFGMVTRLAEQKGLDLLAKVMDPFLSRKVQMVILGDGDHTYESSYRNFARKHAENCSALVGFGVAESHQIYAGSDFLLMPSLFEPCGLGQMIALKYGTLPVVRKTGGLADTIVDADEYPKRGNGFVFKERDPEELLDTLDRALSAFEDKKRFGSLRKSAMHSDFSWDRSAHAYKEYYREILQ